MGERHKLLILYATQTGNALDAAERIGREAERRGCRLVSVLSTNQFQPSLLPNVRQVVFVVSTTGQGDAPDTMKAFWRHLLQKKLTSPWLEGVQYAVFGLGDSGYQKFNVTAIKLNRRLSNLGAKTIIKTGLGDDQNPLGYEGALDPWMSTLWSALDTIPQFFPNGLYFVIPDMNLVDKPKVIVTFHDVDMVDPQFSATSDLDARIQHIETARLMSLLKFSPDNCRPHCMLKMRRNSSLTRTGCGKDVRHLEFEFLSLAIEYDVGDILDILPAQKSEDVDAFIKRCRLDPEALITVQSKDATNDAAQYAARVPMKLKAFVELTMDVASASPRRYFFEVMSFYATDVGEKEKLKYFASREGSNELYQYCQKDRKTILEVLVDFPSVQMPFEWLVQLVPPLRTRAYSISSSPAAHPAQVHLTVNVVSWAAPDWRKQGGLCSNWLAGLDPKQGVPLPVWFRKGSLRVPPPSLPLILVGPGTGCAPFRGFVAERAEWSYSSFTAPILFFFGCRNEDNDFLYREFWLSHTQGSGTLSEEKGGGFCVAYSRDQPKKIYVQDKIRDHSQKIWNLLNEGAVIYVVGSSTKMPADVMTAFEDIISKESNVSKEEAAKRLKQLVQEGRYNVEAWS